MSSRLTTRKLEAIIEALLSRTAGEIDIGDDPDGPSIADYEQALEWALDQAARRRAADLRSVPSKAAGS